MSVERSLIAFTSVTFRDKSAKDVLRIAGNNSVTAIEWGGDIHVPPGDMKRAQKIRVEGTSRRIKPISYGSYFTLNCGMDFQPWLETTLAIGAKNIRIWAGDIRKRQTEFSSGELKAVAAELRSVCECAGAHNVTVSLEKHRNTFTQNPVTALRLIEETAMPNLKIYWQPNPELPIQENEDAIWTLISYISNVHVFSWSPTNERLPLESGAHAWRHYIDLLGERCYILEFVRDASEIQFAEDISVLRGWLAQSKK